MVNRLALYLVAGCLVFGTIVFLELGPAATDDAALPEIAARPHSPPAKPPPQSPRAQELLETILARPLFSATRRPETATVDAAGDTDLSDKRLTGIVTEPGRHIAIFAVKDAKPLILAEGESISGWRIDTIAPLEVSLSGPAGSKTLRPKPDPNLAPPPGPLSAATGAARPPALPPAAAMQRNPAVPPNIPGMPLPRPARVVQRP